VIWVLTGPGLESVAPWPQRYIARYLRAVKLIPKEQGRVIVAVAEVFHAFSGEVRFPPQEANRGPADHLYTYDPGCTSTVVKSLNLKSAEEGESFIVTDAMRLVVVKPMAVKVKGRGGVKAP
jgi:hypothetical protein